MEESKQRSHGCLALLALSYSHKCIANLLLINFNIQDQQKKGVTNYHKWNKAL